MKTTSILIPFALLFSANPSLATQLTKNTHQNVKPQNHLRTRSSSKNHDTDNKSNALSEEHTLSNNNAYRALNNKNADYDPATGKVCNEERQLQSISVSPEEKNNFDYVNEERVRNGLKKLQWSTDLVKEAQRWALYLAQSGKESRQQPLSQNIDNGWRHFLTEIISKNHSVARDGAHSLLMKRDRQYDMLSREINRIGVGIAADEVHPGNYIMVQIYKQV